MTEQTLIVFGVLAGAIGLFAWGRLRADGVAIMIVLALMLSRVLTPKEALAGFGDPVVLLIAAIFVVGEALVNTGVALRLGDAVAKVGRGNEARLIVLVMLLVGVIGAFMNSTAVVAIFIPVVLSIADKTRLNRKRMLMPLSVAALMSGMMTLVASSPNMIIEDALRARGLPPLRFFSWTPFGVSVLAAGIAFMLLTRGLLGKQITAVKDRTGARSTYDVVVSYGLFDRFHRFRVSAGSSLLHRTVAQLRDTCEHFGVVIVGFEKHLHGKQQFLPALPETVFEVNDVIYVVVGDSQAPSFSETQRLEQLPRLEERQRALAFQEIGVAEVMLAPESQLFGRTVGELEFQQRYHLSVLALRHRGQPLTSNLPAQLLDFGDTLLLAGGWDALAQLWSNRQNFVVLTLPAEYTARLPARKRAPFAVGIVVAMVAVMAFELMPNAAAALLAALAMIATGCVPLDSVYRVISWKSLVLIAGLLPLATALTKTGATVLMANELVSSLGALGPIAMLVVVFGVTSVIGLFLSNSATAVLIAPVAVEAAQKLHVSPNAFAMTVSIACCAAFVTPVSSPVNMLVMEPAGYTFSNFLKVGLPLLLLTMVVTIALVAVIYPL
jgi:di/tricarboxylate transporter